MKPIDVAFVGAGQMAREHIRAFSDMPGVNLAGIHSRTREKAEAVATEYGVGPVCESIADLYDQTSASLVVIAVSELSVREVCFEAFRFPWTCLVEKPAGYNVADAESIAAEAHRSGSRAFVALNRRHYSSTKSVVEDLENGSEPRLIHIYDQEDPRVIRDLGRPELVVKNWMYANSIHVIDYLAVLGRGEIESVDHVVRWDPADPRFVVTRVSFSSGDIGIYEAIWNGPGPWAVTVTTQAKRWELRPLEQASFQLHGSRTLVPVPVDEWDSEFKPGLRAQAEEAVRAARGEAHRLPDLEEALVSMKLVQSIYAE